MKKVKITISLPKPRNPVALAACQRQGGVHDKTEKVKRRNARQALRKAIRQGRDDFPPFLRLYYSENLQIYSEGGGSA
ncbi:hypothetical protein [Chitinimonas sp. BJB300]|uniref:hypothetical protein n=1 Tax=Chitinimonas sp. BJB300 TaxID=1559339 RepID=UPI000C0CB608|nr:hypothetical protein [Chitinimonas sp. BJB300]PHV12419.1 hypothetical protein CSQ89_05915 [Chitinimonas sp. BJB300]TSJ89018.1 hypothetical protein FG002_009035 [Chitinimonas sp. BJB300]